MRGLGLRSRVRRRAGGEVAAQRVGDVGIGDRRIRRRGGVGRVGERRLCGGRIGCGGGRRQAADMLDLGRWCGAGLRGGLRALLICRQRRIDHGTLVDGIGVVRRARDGLRGSRDFGRCRQRGCLRYDVGRRDYFRCHNGGRGEHIGRRPARQVGEWIVRQRHAEPRRGVWQRWPALFGSEGQRARSLERADAGLLRDLHGGEQPKAGDRKQGGGEHRTDQKSQVRQHERPEGATRIAHLNNRVGLRGRTKPTHAMRVPRKQGESPAARLWRRARHCMGRQPAVPRAALLQPAAPALFADGPVAQWLEPAAHNGLVGGSSPPGPTTSINSH